MACGPRMGKITFLKQIAAVLTEETAPVLIDLQTDKSVDLARRIPGGRDPVVLLLDGCEALLPDPVPFLNQIIKASAQSGQKVRSTVWAGTVPWGEWAMAHTSEFDCPMRNYPLVVIPPKEARPFLRHHLPKTTTSSELERLLELAGGHPYLLSRVIQMEDVECDSFFSDLWNAADSPSEHDVLEKLIEAGSWVYLGDLKTKTGGRFPKKVLDRLANLGLIIRTLVDGAAAVKTTSPLLDDWARKQGQISA